MQLLTLTLRCAILASAAHLIQATDVSATNASDADASLDVDTIQTSIFANPTTPIITFTSSRRANTTAFSSTQATTATNKTSIFDCCSDLSCSDNSICPCCSDQSCSDLTKCSSCCPDHCSDTSVCLPPCCSDTSCPDMTQCLPSCCHTQSCVDMTTCYPCCNDMSCSDFSVCYAPIPAIVCDPKLQQNIAPLNFVIFQASDGDWLSLGDTAFIMARFPDGVCNLPDPYTLGDQCTPKIEVALRISVGGKQQNGLVLNAARDLRKIETDYNILFEDQPEFHDQLTNRFAYAWIYLLQVDAGISTTNLDVNWIQIPKSCNRNITFNNSKITYATHSLTPNVTIDTLPPQIASVYSTSKSGNFTAGSFIDIVVKFSKDVDFSPLPDIYSQVLPLFLSIWN
jgi:hypothetical protein